MKIKRAAFIAPVTSIEESRVFECLCKEAGINDLLIFTHGELRKDVELKETARKDALKALSRTQKPEAIICGGEIATYAVLQAVFSKGLKIPEDIHIISVAEQDDMQQRLPVPADIIVLSFSALAQEGAEMLHNMLKGKFPKPHIKYIKSNLLKKAQI